MNTTTRILLAATLLASLSACGNKGPLVQAPRPDDMSEDQAIPDAGAAATPTGTGTVSEIWGEAGEPVFEIPAGTVVPAPQATPADATEPTPVDPTQPQPSEPDDGTP